MIVIKQKYFDSSHLTVAMFSPHSGRRIPKYLRLSWFQMFQNASLLEVLLFGLLNTMEITYKSKSDIEKFDWQQSWSGVLKKKITNPFQKNASFDILPKHLKTSIKMHFPGIWWVVLPCIYSDQATNICDLKHSRIFSWMFQVTGI